MYDSILGGVIENPTFSLHTQWAKSSHYSLGNTMARMQWEILWADPVCKLSDVLNFFINSQ